MTGSMFDSFYISGLKGKSFIIAEPTTESSLFIIIYLFFKSLVKQNNIFKSKNLLFLFYITVNLLYLDFSNEQNKQCLFRL